MKAADRAPCAETNPSRHLIQFEHVVCEEDQHRAIGSQCQSTTYSAGDAFIERPGEVDDVLNAGTAPYVLYVTFPRVPPGGSARIDEPDPGTCPGI